MEPSDRVEPDMSVLKIPVFLSGIGAKLQFVVLGSQGSRAPRIVYINVDKEQLRIKETWVNELFDVALAGEIG